MNDNEVVVDVQWLGIKSAESLTWHDPRIKKYFNLRPHPGLLNEFGIARSHQVVPYSLVPTDGFLQIVAPFISRSMPVGTRFRPPVTLDVGSPSPPLELVSITGELFPGEVLISKVRARQTFAGNAQWFENHYSDLLSLRSPHSMPVVQSIMRWFHALALGRRELAKSETLFRHYFAIRIRAPESSDGRSVFPVTTQRQATALLIGAPDLLAGLGQAVVDALMEENRILNQKAESETLLINSQGVLYATPGGSYKSPHPNRFGKLSDLTTLAVYAREYLGDEVGFSSRWPIFSGLVGAEIGRMIDSQSVTFGSSFSNHQTWARLAGSLHLTAHLDDWRRSRQSLHSVNSGVLQIDRLPGRWWETEDIGSILESRRSGASDPLASVLPSELRELIRSDWDESKRCLAAGNYRASVVMSGAAVEGLLLVFAVRNSGANPGNSLYGKGLQELLDKCCPKYNEKIPKGDPIPTRVITVEAASVINNACRNWRNYIHPGLVMRTLGSVTEQMANASLSALELLVTEL